MRDPVGVVPCGRPVVPLGDAFMSFDPLGAQGANMGNRLAGVLVAAIVARGGEPFDRAWTKSVYDGFYTRWGEPSMRWTHLLLEPMKAPARYLLLAQEGADGRTLGGTPKQRVADAFAQNFDNPIELLQTFKDVATTRRWVTEIMGGRADWEAAKGLVAVGGRQIRNALSL